MLKRIIYIILLAQLLVIGCSSFIDLGADQASIDNIRKAQEVAKISKDIYDIQNIFKNKDVNFATVSANLSVHGLKEYHSMAELVSEVKSMAKSLEDGDLSVKELEEYSNFTGTLISVLTPPLNQTKGLYSGSSQSTKRTTKVVTLADINATNLDNIEDFKLPDGAFLLERLNILDSLYYYQNELFTGIAYSLFDNGQIGEFKTIKDGRLSGPAYAWYENGAYAMQASFLNGYLAGRFIAWSEVGDLIYDIYFDKGQFQSDLQFERDTTREEQDAETGEGEADSEANSGE